MSKARVTIYKYILLNTVCHKIDLTQPVMAVQYESDIPRWMIYQPLV